MSEIKPCRDKWKGIMTDRQRFKNQMHYKPIDRCFNMEFGYWTENFEVWPIFKNNGITNNEQADRFFNFDRFVKCLGEVWMCPPFEEKVIEEKGDKKIIISTEGLLAEVPKDGHSTIPHYLKSCIQTPKDWEHVKAERFSLDDPARKIDLDELKRKYPPDRDFPVGVDCGSMIGKVRDLLTLESLAYSIYDYPKMVEDMIETSCQLVEHFLDQVLGVIDFDFASGWEDICFKNGPMVSVDFFKNLIVPRYKRISKRLHAHGIDIWYTDCDGDLRPILPLLLESGINCLFPFEVNCCAHPGELLNQFGKDLRIMGGFDKMQLSAGRDAIKKYVESLIPLVERGGYIPFCDHRCPPNVKQEDYLYYLDLKEQFFGMK